MNAPSPSLPPVGFAGVGNIGAPMASCLLRAGYPLRVLDPRPAAVAPLRDAGATVADQVADLAACQVVALAVPDDAAVEQVLVGDGLLDLLPPGATVLVHSTILPQTARELAGRAAAAGRVAVLDAPVSGGAERAAAGTLAVMVGGPAEALERVRPVLETLAAEVVHAGPAGAGAAVKLANQLAMFAALAGVEEALALARRHEVATDTALKVLRAGTGDSWAARTWGFFDALKADYDAAGTPVRYRPWSKDLWDVVAAARAAELSLPVAGLLAQLLPDQVEHPDRS